MNKSRVDMSPAERERARRRSNEYIKRTNYRYQKAYRRSRRGRLKARERNDRIKQYQKTSKGVAALRAGSINKAAKQRGMKGKITAIDIFDLFADARCFYCGSQENLQVDHKMACSFGGSNIRDNLVLLCAFHHTEKTSWEKKYLTLGDEMPQWIQKLIDIPAPLQLDLFHVR